MKRKVIVVITLLIACLACVSCGSNGSKSKVCPICKQSMEGKTTVKAKTVDGQTLTVCSSCYAVGKQAGYCL